MPLVCRRPLPDRGLLVLALLLSACGPPGIDTLEGLGEGESGFADEGGAFGPQVSGLCSPPVIDPCAGLARPHQCCSVDPAAIDPGELVPDSPPLPGYEGGPSGAVPLFSGSDDGRSRFGVCVRVGSTPEALALPTPEGCPLPCNPRWSAAELEALCGPAAQCCQAEGTRYDDCVFDPALGDTGCYRPVDGNDIAGLGGLDATYWASDEHVTHQDPSGTQCDEFVSQLPQSFYEEHGLDFFDMSLACYRRLTVADQRGYCQIAAEPCPAVADACGERNTTEGRTSC